MAETNIPIDRLEAPKEWDCTIPQPLLASCDEKERWLYTAIGQMDAQNQWLIRNIIEENRRLRDVVAMLAAEARKREELAARVDALGTWKLVWEGKWALVSVVLVAVTGAVIKHLFDKWVGKP